MGQPDGGWVGRVVKVGPKLVHITYPYAPQAKACRKADGRSNDRYGNQSFKTVEQAARHNRYAAAIAVLREHGIEVSPRHGQSVTVEQAEELAEVVQGW
jgi:hypothetical protein